MGTVGLPSVALACTDWRDSGGHQLYSAENIAAKDWWSDAAQDRPRHGHWGHGWNGKEHSGPGSAASKSPTAAASTPKSTAPKPRTTAPTSTAKNTPKNTAPAPRTTAPTSTPKTTASATPTSPSSPKATASASGVAARIVQLVNAERSKVGCSPVTLNAVLTKAAQAHSEDMAAHRNMSHTGSDGSSPGDRITSAGYIWSTYGENVAYGYATPEQVMAGWMSSPGHKANILNCAFKDIGVGLAQPDSYWTQDFGTAR
ncbi:CAP domain-containing protein [Streptomyces griseus]|uniref:CAP domain-containing protein n=1 Tax=Streptomyces griseus TaxID=1911 RepID=UPI002D21C72F|nr:CAP domain-containing protein [Streptomyces griseus]